jgi:predicted nucleotidyltransferase
MFSLILNAEYVVNHEIQILIKSANEKLYIYIGFHIMIELPLASVILLYSCANMWLSL